MTYSDPRLEAPPRRERVTVERVQRYPAEIPAIHHLVEEPVVAERSPVDTMRRVVWLLFGVLQALILMRVVLLLLGANEANDLVAFVLAATDPFVEPFRGMFSLDTVNGASGTVLDIAALVALVVWTLVEALVLGVVGLADRRATTA